MNQQQPTLTHQPASPITFIDLVPLIEHGESPTAIILAITILISISVSAITGLVRVIVVTKTSR
jgi:hypothetical protein